MLEEDTYCHRAYSAAYFEKVVEIVLAFASAAGRAEVLAGLKMVMAEEVLSQPGLKRGYSAYPDSSRSICCADETAAAAAAANELVPVPSAVVAAAASGLTKARWVYEEEGMYAGRASRQAWIDLPRTSCQQDVQAVYV